MTIVARKVVISMRRVGVVETVRLGIQKRGYLREFTPSARRAKRDPDAFDLAHGVRTSAIVDLGELELRDDYVHGFRHQPSPPDRFRAIVGALPIRHADFSFVDLGSGLGRALLLAAEFPFRAILGVECSPELHAIAEDNLRRYATARPGCSPLAAICMNAADFPFPDGPLVVYLYNPFDDLVMQRILANLRASLASQPRPVLIVYYWPKLAALLDASTFLTPLDTGPDYRVYTARPIAHHTIAA